MKTNRYFSRGGPGSSPVPVLLAGICMLTIALSSQAQVQNNDMQLTLTNGITLSTNSAWTNTAPSVVTNHGTIITSENWVNSGTYSNTSLGGFELRYATTKTFTLGGTLLAQLKINGAAGVSLSSMTISGNLNLANGIITTNTPATDILTLSSGATITGGSTASYVDGIMTRKGTGDLAFPLGKASKFMPVTFYAVVGTAPEVNVRLLSAPTIAAGTGVSGLTAFPYVWKANTLINTDSASFVEIQYPISMLNVSNPVVARNHVGNTNFDSMGAQSFTTSDPVKVKSLSSGLRGSFIVEQGLSGTLALPATALTATGFTANWNAASGATGYRLDISTDNFNTFVSGFNNLAVASNSQVVTGLASNAAYRYRVRVEGGGTSLNSNPVDVTTLLPAPAATAASAVAQTTFTANWNAVSGAISYELDISTDNFSTFLAGYNAKSDAGTSDNVTGLTPGTTYQYRVRAVNISGPSTNSNVITTYTITVAPVASAATAVSTTGFTANWGAVTGGVSYLLDISADNFSTYLTGYNAKSVSGTSDVVTGLTINAAYKYRVRAINGGGAASANSNSIDATTLAPAPVATAATAILQTGFTANWGAVTGATSYQLDISADNFATFIAGFNSKSESGTSDVVVGLTAGTAYKYRVRAVNAGGTSANSNAIDVSTLVAPPAATVATSATAITQTGFTANWNLIGGATSYQLDISADNFNTFVTGYNSKSETGTSDVITGLTAGTAYKYRVRAVNAGGTSVNSNVIDVTTISAIQSQTITFPAITTKTFGDAAFNLAATASSGLPVSYATTSAKVTLAGSQVTLVAAGSVTISASQAGNTSFSAATSVAQTFCINPAKPTIALSGANTEAALLTSSSPSGNQWFKDGSAIAGATGSTLTLKDPGSYTVNVTADNCVSQTSAAQLIIVTGDLLGMLKENMLLFPNPVREKLTVQLNGFEAQPVNLMVYDLNGRIMDQLAGLGKSEVSLDVSRYAAGKYILRASQQEKVAQQHFVKE